MPGLLYADESVFCGEPKEDLREMVGRFVEGCKGRGLKDNAGKIKVMLLGWEEGLDYELCVDGIRGAVWSDKVFVRKD